MTAPVIATHKIRAKSFFLKDTGLCSVAGVIATAEMRYTIQVSSIGFIPSKAGLARVETEPKNIAESTAKPYPALLDNDNM